jgi:hypothetical protein
MGNVLTAMHPDRGDGLVIWKGKDPWRIHQRFKCEKLLLEHPDIHISNSLRALNVNIYND